MTNLEKYKKDIDSLIERGKKILSYLKWDNLDLFRKRYETWYSESLSLIEIVLPNRAADFRKYYSDQKEKGCCLRDSLTGNYELYALYAPKPSLLFSNQLGIVQSAKRKFESSLFNIKQLVQADLFDSELDAARELNKKGFTRGGWRNCRSCFRRAFSTSLQKSQNKNHKKRSLN